MRFQCKFEVRTLKTLRIISLRTRKILGEMLESPEEYSLGFEDALGNMRDKNVKVRILGANNQTETSTRGDRLIYVENFVS